MFKVVWFPRVFVPSLSIAIGLLGAAACGSAEPTPAPTPTLAPVATATTAVATPTPTATATPTPAPVAKPKRGGILKEQASEDPNGFDAQNATTAAWTIHTGKLYNMLLWNPDGKSIAPDAVESYSISADGKVWTFKLRGDVRFQSYPDNPGPRDGTLMTAADAVYSLKKIMGLVDQVASARSGWMREFVDLDRPDEGVAVIDERTLQVYLTQPFPDLAKILILDNSVIYPEGTTRDMLVKRPYGSGAFKLKGFQRGSMWTYERDPAYFKADEVYLNEIREVILQGGRAITNVAFLTGQTDIGRDLPTADNRSLYRNMVAEGKIVTNNVPGTCTVQGVYMNSTKPPFNNPKLRKAVHLALDRKGYIETVYSGDAVPVTYVPSGKLPWFLTEEEIWKLPGYRQPKDQDLAEAKRIMAEEAPQGLQLTLYARDSGNYPAMAEFNAGNLKKIGIDVTISLAPSSVLFPRLTAWNYEIASYCMTMITITAAEQFGGYYITGASRNWLAFNNREIDEMYPRMVAAEGADQAAMIRKMEQIMWDYIPYAPMAASYDSFNYYSFVKDYPLASPANGFSYYSVNRLSQVWRSDV
ncbi:MAG: ABC transporter substrate-binding protein [Chloroflexi bacterium]|nr:ABC transporter substrate-binding protein [Chloroflexota bacterium]